MEVSENVVSVSSEGSSAGEGDEPVVKHEVDRNEGSAVKVNILGGRLGGRVKDVSIERKDNERSGSGLKKLKERVRKRKGRGFTVGNPSREVLDGFESVAETDNEGSDVQAQRSMEGWILIVTGIHEEAHEDDVQGRFSDFGEVKNLHLNLDRRTGFLKGYAMIEYEHFKDAVAAKNGLDGSDLLGNTINVDWAFTKKPPPTSSRSRRH